MDLKQLVLAAALASSWVPGASADDQAVVATIKPIHALVAAVMDGAGAPRLLIEGGSSPHSFSLKPSDMRVLTSARVVFTVADTVEPFMGRIRRSLPRAVRVVTLIDTQGLSLHKVRAGGDFERHDHKARADQGKGHAKKAHGHGHGAEHDHEHGQAGTTDGHVWLDPANAKVIVARVADILAETFPGSAALYKANAARIGGELDDLSRELAADMAPLSAYRFVVFHDAYQYFEKRFGLTAAGSVTLSPELAPSASRLKTLRAKIARIGATCVFSEPQFEPRLVATVTEGTKARTGVLDPLGAALAPGPDLYPKVLKALAASLRGCLRSPS